MSLSEIAARWRICNIAPNEAEWTTSVGWRGDPFIQPDIRLFNVMVNSVIAVRSVFAFRDLPDLESSFDGFAGSMLGTFECRQ